MLKLLITALVLIVSTSCTTSREQMFLSMSEAELEAYNAELPERRQIVCAEGVRRGTVGLARTVCTSKARMGRLAQRSPSGDYDFSNALFNSGFNQNIPGDRSVLPRVYFSPPPPGYDRPVIHVQSPRH